MVGEIRGVPVTKSTLTRVCNLHNSSVDGVFHEPVTSQLIANAVWVVYLCKQQLHALKLYSVEWECRHVNILLEAGECTG